MKILIINGPNLNLLGAREPQVYGGDTLTQIKHSLDDMLINTSYELDFFQSNHEGEIVDKIHTALEANVKFIIINPAAYTHTSIAIRDALIAVKIPFIEIHLSNVHARESFRQHSYLSDIAVGVICGLGTHGYKFAMTYALTELNSWNKSTGNIKSL